VLAGLRTNGAPDGRIGAGGRHRIARPRAVAVNAVVPTVRDRTAVAGSAGNALYVARFRTP
jgi:hypothetical protein